MKDKELFKERRKARKQRRKEYKQARTDSFLIVTEGEKTEPHYFKGLKDYILKNAEGNIDIVPIVEIEGEGKNTKSLVDAAAELNRKADIIYQNVWVVMDKDDFPKFDEAIASAESKGFCVAWSNQSFEYWLYLHFNYSDAALHRDDWEKKLNGLFRRHNLGKGVYEKNDPEIFTYLQTINGPSVAIKNAMKRMRDYDPRRTTPSEHDPGTTVHSLVEQLLSYC